METGRAALVYFAVVFGIGFVLGVVRTLLVQPLVGSLAAVLIELPVILGFAWLACARILRHWPLGLGQSAVMGMLAFALLMVGEVGVSLLFGGRSFSEHLALYSEGPRQLGLAGQMMFAAFPWWQTRRRLAAR